MKPKDMEEFVSECYKAADALEAERLTRANHRHTEDSRIATEIAEKLFWLGRHIAQHEAQNERYTAAIETNKDSIFKLSGLFRRLEAEMKNAMCRDHVREI